MVCPIPQGDHKEEETGEKYNVRICYAGGHKEVPKWRSNDPGCTFGGNLVTAWSQIFQPKLNHGVKSIHLTPEMPLPSSSMLVPRWFIIMKTTLIMCNNLLKVMVAIACIPGKQQAHVSTAQQIRTVNLQLCHEVVGNFLTLFSSLAITQHNLKPFTIAAACYCKQQLTLRTTDLCINNPPPFLQVTVRHMIRECCPVCLSNVGVSSFRASADLRSADLCWPQMRPARSRRPDTLAPTHLGICTRSSLT